MSVQGEEAPGEDTGETGTGPHNIELKAGLKSVKVVLYLKKRQGGDSIRRRRSEMKCVQRQRKARGEIWYTYSLVHCESKS